MLENLGIRTMLDELQYEVDRIAGIANQIHEEEQREKQMNKT
jgi:hypothetical protein